MKAFFIILFLVPTLLFAQNKGDSYAIYSQFFKLYNEKQPSIGKLVVKQSTQYGRKYGKGDIANIAIMFRDYLKGKKYVLYTDENKNFIDTIKKDTLWLGLIDKLEQKMNAEYGIDNRFSKELDVSILSNHSYDNYFNGRDFRKDWDKFHKDYPKSLLIELSEIVNDDKRAVFYFSGRCGGLCGKGELVLFYKENSEWKFLQTLSIWLS